MLEDQSIYLDHANTTPIRREVLDKMLPVLCHFTGGRTGAHSVARRANLITEEARRNTLDCLGTEGGNLRFTASGYHASELAILGLALSQTSGHIITTLDEDEGVLAACQTLEKQGFRVSYLPLDERGWLDPELVADCIEDDTVLLSVALVNRFTGFRQPVENLATLCRAHQILLHTDFSLGCLQDIKLEDLGVDALSLSSHLIRGPQGIGALWTRDSLELNHPCLECENLANIVGFTQALCFLVDERSDWVASFQGLRDEFLGLLEAALPQSDVCVPEFGGHAGIITLMVEGPFARELVYQLDRWGVSAFETPYGVRFSLGRTTTSVELQKAVSAIESAMRTCLPVSLDRAS
jgi:cysteine desulfurase